MAFPLPPSPSPRYILLPERRLSTKATMSVPQIKNLAPFSRRGEGLGGSAPDSTVGTTTAPAAATSGKPAVAAIPVTYRSTSVMTRTATICSLPASLAPTPSKQPNSSLSSIAKAFPLYWSTLRPLSRNRHNRHHLRQHHPLSLRIPVLQRIHCRLLEPPSCLRPRTHPLAPSVAL